MAKTVVYLQKSDQSGKKYKVTILKPNGSRKTVHFGATGYSDYTKHKDKERMKRYDTRHRSSENWGKSGIDTAGFWSKWILWSAPSLGGAIRKTASKFNLSIRRGAPPKKSARKSTHRSKKRSPRRKSRSKSRKSQRKSRKSKRKSTRKSKRKSKRKSRR